MKTVMTAFEYEMKETVLSVENVNVTYDDTPILRDVSFEIKNVTRPGMRQGQVVGLLGPSGMGKTTLFRLLSGLDQPDSGDVLLNSTREPVERGRGGVVTQDYHLFLHRTVMGNMMVVGFLVLFFGGVVKAKAEVLLLL